MIDPRIGVFAVVLASALAVAIALVRIIRGPTNADRVIAWDILVAASVAFAIAASRIGATTVFLDLALGIALIGFVGTLAWSKAVERLHADDDR